MEASLRIPLRELYPRQLQPIVSSQSFRDSPIFALLVKSRAHTANAQEVGFWEITGHRDPLSPYQLLAANHRKTGIMLAMPVMVKELAAAPTPRAFSNSRPRSGAPR